MSRLGQYTDSASAGNPEQPTNFRDSQEAKFRTETRRFIRKGPFTKSQRDVVLAFVNHWFANRRKKDGVVHPGREKLAKKAGVSVNTVKRTLALLRATGAIRAEAHLGGLEGNATEYTVDMAALIALCGLKKEALPVIGGPNEPGHGRAKMAHRISNVVPFPSQKGAA